MMSPWRWKDVAVFLILLAIFTAIGSSLADCLWQHFWREGLLRSATNVVSGTSWDHNCGTFEAVAKSVWLEMGCVEMAATGMACAPRLRCQVVARPNGESYGAESR
jgi:hypothetical protein